MSTPFDNPFDDRSGSPVGASSQAARLGCVAIATLILLAIGLRLAWLGDDAYITLRTVENQVHGLGLRWNPDERVQTYTHPLWMFVLLLARIGSGEAYFTTIFVALGTSLLAVVMLLLRGAAAPAVVLIAAVLACTRAFGDYMTSGLETPLTFVLLVAFVIVAGRQRASPESKFVWVVALSGLLALNRMDLAVLCLPTALASMAGVSWRRVVKLGLLASSPMLAWLLFAGFYYGSPLPVTAHAKAFGVGIDADELAQQGLRYLLHTLLHDPVLAVVAIGGPFLLLVPARSRWLGLGCLCYVVYVVKVGGGFMQGRFLLPPFVVVLACLGRWASRLSWSRAGWSTAVVIGVALASGLPGWATPPADDHRLDDETIEAQHGIVDERLMYYGELGLWSPKRALPVYGRIESEVFDGEREDSWFLLNGAVGVAGIGVGARGHIVDPILCDPLLARLPARDPSRWRIGHVLRRVPEGYWETLAFGDNVLHHEGLRRYYDGLRTRMRAPLFSPERIGALFAACFGVGEDGLRDFIAEQYRLPPRLEADAATLPQELAEGAYWFDSPGIRVVYDGGLAVRFRTAVTSRELLVDAFGLGRTPQELARFVYRFVLAGDVLGEAVGVALPPSKALPPMRFVAGMRKDRVVVPDCVPQFDTLWIEVELTSNSHLSPGPRAIGAIRLR